MATSEINNNAVDAPTTEEGISDKGEWCTCCNQVCSDLDRFKFHNRFNTNAFKERREAEWAALDKKEYPTPPGKFPFMNLPRELRDSIYHMLLGGKTEGGYFTHDHIFPTQALYINRQTREEFMDALFSRIWVMAQYSMSKKHIESVLPPATVLHRVQDLFIRLAVTDAHGLVLPSWDQVFYDTTLLLSMFPKLDGAIVSFKGIFNLEKTLDESSTDAARAWEESPLRDVAEVRKIEFEFESGERIWSRKIQKYTYQRENFAKGAEWLGDDQKTPIWEEGN